jgi:hypothetical protein
LNGETAVKQKFEVRVNPDAKETRVEMSGALNEHAELPDLRMNLPIHINLKNLTMLNSLGTKSWVTWARRFRPPVKIHLEQCPPVFVKSFSMVKGFLTDTMQVDSFFVPFYSTATGERKDFLVVRGEHFDKGAIKVPELTDSKGNVMESDVSSNYFSFLKP